MDDDSARTEQSKDRADGASRKPGPLAEFFLRHRLPANLVIHGVLFTCALLLAYMIRYDAAEKDAPWFATLFLPWLPYFVGLKLLLFGHLHLFRSQWQYASIRDVANILLASWLFVLISFVLYVVFFYLPTRMGYTLAEMGPVIEPIGRYFARVEASKGILLLDFVATVFLVCTARLGIRIYREELRPVSSEGLRRVLIVGAGSAAEAIIREILRMPTERYRVVGLVDDDPKKRHLMFHGVSVLGTTDEIPRLCQEQKVDEILIAMPSATQAQKKRVIDECTGTKLQFKMLPGVGDLIDGKVTVSQIRPVDINDLLGRDVVELDAEAIARFIQGRRVLVTGAGGSIGSEMCRQICRFGPGELILVEQAETPLFEIENELRREHGGLNIIARICDIYDRDRVFAVWQNYRPDVVIHAAAHKHVPLMEANPSEAIKNNILGSKNVADASCRFGAAEFVTISTDKAVNPSSVMGASKRVAEIYTQALNGRDGCRTQFKAVRFGNVLGSAGSVVPIFKRQIAAGGPVTVTDPRMTRYFMTIPEAAQLVLQAAATGAGGQIYLLDMGEPVKIVDLARQMIILSGFVPGEDIEIQFSGTRPGEKLFEELRTAGEDVEPTVHPKVVVWKSCPTDWSKIEAAFERLESLSNSLERLEVVAAIRQLVPEFRPPDGRLGPADAAASPAEPASTTTEPAADNLQEKPA